MTTITIERELLEQALVALSAPNHRVFSESPICVDIRAALAAPATAPEREPITEECIKELYGDSNFDIVEPSVIALVRAIEAFHGIKENKP